MKPKTIGIFYVELGLEDMRDLARIAIEQVRRVVPEARIVQFSNQGDKILPGVNEIQRLYCAGMGLMEARIKLFSKYEGEILLIDPDVWMQKDPFEVFEDEKFDVALTRRDENVKLVIKDEGKPLSGDMAKVMPYNTGVMFSRNPKFWTAVLERMKSMSMESRNWFGDQIAVKKVAESRRFKVLELPCNQYNFSPTKKEEDVSDKIMVHYKGNRKAMMLERGKEIANA